MYYYRIFTYVFLTLQKSVVKLKYKYSFSTFYSGTRREDESLLFLKTNNNMEVMEEVKKTYLSFIIFNPPECFLTLCSITSKNYLNSFIIKPTRCTNFTNIFWHETVHVSDSSSVHHQEFIHRTLSNGICHTGLLTDFEQDQDGTAFPSRSCSKEICYVARSHECKIF